MSTPANTPPAAATPPPSVVNPSAASAATPQPAHEGLNTPMREALSKAFERKPATSTPPAATPAAKADATPPQASTETAPKTEKRTSVFDKKPAAKPEGEAAKPESNATPQEFPEDKWTLPENAGPEAQTNAKQMKALIKQQRAEMEALKAKVSTPVATGVESEEVTRLKAEHKAALDRLAILDLQSHPEHLKTFVEPRNKALSEAKEILGWSGKGDANLQAIMALAPKEFNAEISKLIEGLNPADSMTVLSTMRQAYKLAGDEKGLLSRAGEVQQQLRAKAEHQQKAAFEETWNKLGPMGDFLTTLDEPDNATPEQRQEISDYNAAVRSVRDNAQKYAFNPSDERSVALMASKAATMDFLLSKGIPQMEREYRAMVADNARLAKELAAARGSASPGTVAGDLKPNSEQPGKVDMAQLAKTIWKPRSQ